MTARDPDNGQLVDAETEFTCECGYMNYGIICTKCGKVRHELAQAVTNWMYPEPHHEPTTLSEIIAQLEHNESVKFSSHLHGMRIVIKKGDHPKNNKTVVVELRRKELEQPSIDAITFGVARGLSAIRKDNISNRP